jgi:hypothetical protein
MRQDGLYGWMDRTYESIPKRHRMTRIYWLYMQKADAARKAKIERLHAAVMAEAIAQVDAEDFAATMPPALLGSQN